MKLEIKTSSVLALVAITMLALAAACGGGDPENLTFDVTIRDGNWDVDGGIIRVKQGDSVTINLVSDVAGEVHLHGYDILSDVTPDGEVTFEFTADATGSFGITLHVTSDESEAEEHDEDDDHPEVGGQQEDEIDLGSLQVFPR
jgi:hypothetical protein